MGWWIVLGVFVAAVSYLLLMPLLLLGDTATRTLEFRAGHLVWARLEEDPEELLRLHLHVPFANYYWRPTDLARWHRKPKKVRNRRAGTDRKKHINWLRVLKTFRVRYFSWDLDTGDPVWNAKLYPVAFLLQYQGIGVRVNFWQQNRLAFRISNQPIRLLKSIVKP